MVAPGNALRRALVASQVGEALLVDAARRAGKMPALLYARQSEGTQ